MTTLSQVIDEIVEETGHQELRLAIPSWLHQTLRELHFNDATPMKYPDNLFEDYVTADSDEGYLYPLVAPQQFQVMESVYYETRGIYAPPRSPAASMAFLEQINGDVYHYRTGGYIALSGYGGTGATVKIAYYLIPPRLQDFKNASLRPAQWDEENQVWVYLPAYDVDATTRADALTKTTNWLLLRHKEVIMEGVRAKLYKRLNDPDRAKIAFSAYNSMKGIVFSEAANFIPDYQS